MYTKLVWAFGMNLVGTARIGVYLSKLQSCCVTLYGASMSLKLTIRVTVTPGLARVLWQDSDQNSFILQIVRTVPFCLQIYHRFRLHISTEPPQTRLCPAGHCHS